MLITKNKLLIIFFTQRPFELSIKETFGTIHTVIFLHSHAVPKNVTD